MISCASTASTVQVVLERALERKSGTSMNTSSFKGPLHHYFEHAFQPLIDQVLDMDPLEQDSWSSLWTTSTWQQQINMIHKQLLNS
jgi:hypothetical protein